MQQIADWLEKLGMSEYAQRFAENGIDFSVLPTSDGSGPEGHRRSARASPKDAGCHHRDDRHGCHSACSPRPQLSQSPKTPPSAAKSR